MAGDEQLTSPNEEGLLDDLRDVDQAPQARLIPFELLLLEEITLVQHHNHVLSFKAAPSQPSQTSQFALTLRKMTGNLILMGKLRFWNNDGKFGLLGVFFVKNRSYVSTGQC